VRKLGGEEVRRSPFSPKLVEWDEWGLFKSSLNASTDKGS